jgi:type II secretory pathway pseudopilin PulG
MSPSKLLAPAVIIVTFIVVGAGLYVSGSPMQARRERFDTQRLNDLQQISYAVDSFSMTKQRLPADLEELRKGVNTPTSSYYLGSTKDPKTNTDYEYRLKDSAGNYELCATFETDMKNTQNNSPYNTYPLSAPIWQHTATHTCFQLKANMTAPKPPTM